jgi:hypothetical protein
LRLASTGPGSDLDLGWTGDFHNLPAALNGQLRVCLADCGATSQPVCSGRDGETAAVNRGLFGAPIPVVAGGVAVCVAQRLGTPALGGVRADLRDGTIAGTLALQPELHRTNLTQVCPRCSGATAGSAGVCDSGARQGRACITSAVITVAGARGDARHAVSPDCPPAGVPLATLGLTVPVTTGTAALAGPRPCGATQDDACAGSCTADCAGSACVDRLDGRCVDARGGLSQRCCAADPQRPCFPTGGGVPIVRDGSATPPSPVFGDPAYPKVGGVTLAATFCAPSTGSAFGDALLGLPGPGAVLAPMAAAWLP